MYTLWVIFWGDCPCTTDTRTVADDEAESMMKRLGKESIERGEVAYVQVTNGSGRTVGRFYIGK